MKFVTLEQIFSNRLFRIPDYQRGYAWRSDVEIVDFWNDLMNIPNQKSHFTGSLTLQEITSTDSLGFDRWVCDEGYEALFVIDGQQRLTTSIILLQSICDFLATVNPEDIFSSSSTVKEAIGEIRRKYICVENKRQCALTYIFGYSNNSASDQYLRRYVFNDANVTCSEESYYTLNIKNAKEFFMQNIAALHKVGGIEAIEILYKKLTLQLKFQLIEVNETDDFNIFVAFETINNRGRQLSNLEKLKNRLIYLTTLYQLPNMPFQTAITPIRQHINDGWAEIYRQMGRNVNLSSTGKVAVLDDDEFLKTHWILYFQYSRKTGNDYIKFLLGKHFTTQNVLQNQAEADSVLEYISDEDSNNYDANEEFEPKSSSIKAQLTLGDIRDYVTDLMNTSKAWYYTWFPQDAKAKGELDDEEIKWMQRINRLGIAYFRPLITALFYKRIIAKTITATEVVELLESIERFIFINFRLQTTRSHYGSSEFSIAAKDLHKGTKGVKTIIGMLEERVNKSFAPSSSTIKTKNVQVMVEKLFEQKDDERAGFYRWPAIHYFLYEYNEELGKGYHGVGNCSWEDFKQTEKDKISIEHILPHNVTGYWQNKFNGVSRDHLAIYQGSLGNLLLLSQKINATLQDYDFETKKKGKDGERNGYSKGSYSELEVSKREDWTPAAIEERGLAMLNFMEKRWKFNFQSEEDKKNLLLPGVN